jgi:Domain of unknown function (DUF1906)
MQKIAQIVLALALFDISCFAASRQTYLGFDRNNYPGDAALPALHKSFRYTSYWLNIPPGEKQNGWVGKRALLKSHGFGFLVLFSGRLDGQLKGSDAAVAGKMDGKAAVMAAKKEGFHSNVLIFLDQEEGGRLLPEQVAYLFAWIDAVESAGARAGVYCSGIDVPDGSSTISTARDILFREETPSTSTSQSSNAKSSSHRRLALWIANDQCPPSPGCIQTSKPPSTALPSIDLTSPIIWQYAVSPRRSQFSASCPKNSDPDGNCYAPGLPHSPNTTLDLDVANSPNPSEEP